ncbi:MAG: hypothetical protein R3B97_15855 [Dehalococcoidia bacterium]|nr:hypothetical protein [Dehalococcoidia bacterium]
MRFRVRKIGAVHDFVEQARKSVCREVRVVPFGGPPRVRQQTKAVAVGAQGLQCLASVWEHDRRPIHSPGVAVQDHQQFSLIRAHPQPSEPISDEARRWPAPVVTSYACPVRGLCVHHRRDELFTGRRHGRNGDQFVVGTMPALGHLTFPVGPIEERAAEVENDGTD